MDHLLEVRGLTTKFYTHDGIVNAVNGISYYLDEGETLAIVGESGCGKSVSVLSLLRLIPDPPGRVVAGEALLDGVDLLKIPMDEMRRIRGHKISMVFQDPMTSLNPVLTVGRQLTEALELHLGLTGRQAANRAVELLELVGIPYARDRLNDYPFQFSGGMRQRVMIAMGISCHPRVLIADEPTTALDVTIQAQIVDLVRRLQKEQGMAIIWITHDLGVVAGMADRVIVMYGGYIVEEAPVAELYRNPAHYYTRGLLGSLPRLDADDESEMLKSIEGFPPDLIALPVGCPFTSRCSAGSEVCLLHNPVLTQITPGHFVACHSRNGG